MRTTYAPENFEYITCPICSYNFDMLVEGEKYIDCPKCSQKLVVTYFPHIQDKVLVDTQEAVEKSRFLYVEPEPSKGLKSLPYYIAPFHLPPGKILLIQLLSVFAIIVLLLIIAFYL